MNLMSIMSLLSWCQSDSTSTLVECISFSHSIRNIHKTFIKNFIGGCVEHCIFILKLVRTPLNVYFTAFKSIFLSLTITSYECHAWFHLNAASPAARNTEHGTSEHYKKILIHGRIRTTKHRTSCFPACPSYHSATGTVDDMRLELLLYSFTLRYYKQTNYDIDNIDNNK